MSAYTIYVVTLLTSTLFFVYFVWCVISISMITCEFSKTLIDQLVLLPVWNDRSGCWCWRWGYSYCTSCRWLCYWEQHQVYSYRWEGCYCLYSAAIAGIGPLHLFKFLKLITRKKNSWSDHDSSWLNCLRPRGLRPKLLRTPFQLTELCAMLVIWNVSN